ncbi:MAG: 4'-phosphopantetheinyl transferase superfamily protein [Bacilli bacterium]
MDKRTNYERFDIIKTKECFAYVFITHFTKANDLDIHTYQHNKAYEILLEILEKYFGYSNVIIKKDNKGKPYLENIADIYFSISHRDFYITIAISNLNVGIDIETYHRYNSNISKRCFTLNEQSYIDKDKKTQDRFYEIWTKKEAFIKATNNYSLLLMNKFDVFDKEIINNFRMIKTHDYIVSLYIEDAKEIA